MSEKPYSVHDSEFGSYVLDKDGLRVAWCGTQTLVTVTGAFSITRKKARENAKLIAKLLNENAKK